MTDPATGLPQPSADEVLLEELTRALRRRPVTPPPSRVAALRRAVEQRRRPTARARVMRHLAAWARRWHRTGAAVVVFVGLAGGGAGVALAAAGSITKPGPYSPHDLAIPVVAPAIQKDSSVPKDSSAQVGGQVVSHAAPTTPSPGAEPVGSTGPVEVLVVPVRFSGRPASVGDPTVGVWSRPVETQRDRLHAESGRAGATSGLVPKYGTHGATASTSRPRPQSRFPGPAAICASAAWWRTHRRLPAHRSRLASGGHRRRGARELRPSNHHRLLSVACRQAAPAGSRAYLPTGHHHR